MARFVLIHGGWHGGWCFRRLAEELRVHEHQVSSPDLPCDQVGLTPLDYAREVGPQPDAIVVGHSLAGFTLPHIEARRRVYLAALPPLERATINECYVEGFSGPVLDAQGRSYWPDAETAAQWLYPDCPRPQSDWAYVRLRHQARLEPIPAPFGRGDLVIATMQDAVVKPEWQVHTAHSHGADVIELESGHSPFLTQPKELADLLSSLA
jgi:predicted alpha/beta hydrolase family esterase